MYWLEIKQKANQDGDEKLPDMCLEDQIRVVCVRVERWWKVFYKLEIDGDLYFVLSCWIDYAVTLQRFSETLRRICSIDGETRRLLVFSSFFLAM